MRNSGFRRNSGNSTPRDHHADVTNQIIASLETGTPPWRQPWDNTKIGGPMMPHNATTGTRYRGINVLTLAISPLAFMSGDPRWATYKQAAERGWQVRKGSRGTTGFFYKRIEVDRRDDAGDDSDVGKWIPLLRAFTLFHASQIEGIPLYVAPGVEEAPWRAPDAAETIARNSHAVIRIGGERAFYSPKTLEPPIPDAACTGRAFITPCCTGSVTEFLVNGQLWLAGSVAGHGWTEPWPGSIDDINETGTLVDANGAERPIRWRPTPDNMNE